MDHMDAGVATLVAGLLAAIGTLVAVMVSSRDTHRTNARVAELEGEKHAREMEKAERDAEIAREKTVDDAREEYVKKARMRLYAECEPLLFQFFELAEDASRRVRSLARTSKQGDLKPDGSGWLATDPSGSSSTSMFP